MSTDTIAYYDTLGREIRVAHFAIGTGDKAGYYTLRAFGNRLEHIRTEFGIHTTTEPASIYLRNLSTDRDKAVASARSYLAERFGAARAAALFRDRVDFDLEEIHRISRAEAEARRAAEAARVASTDFRVFQSGKYAGQSIQQVAEADPNYLGWYAQQGWPADSDNGRTAALAAELLRPQLEAAAAARKSQAQVLLEAIGASLNAWLSGEEGDFKRSIAQGLRSGNVPRGRGLEITLSILAKRAGRAGSKAYNAELDRLLDALEEYDTNTH